MPGVLSTRKLETNQKHLVLNAGISLVEYDAIKIELLPFKIPDEIVHNAIITSRNAVRALRTKKLKIDRCFCVGNKTAEEARKHGWHVEETADSSKELGSKIIERHRGRSFFYFCGNLRRDELPQLLKEHDIKLEEITVYQTELNYKKFETSFDGVMFFSPSAVKSYTKENKLDCPAFCIGESTASEARKFTQAVHVSNKPGIENVIAKLVNNLKNKTE